MTGLGPVALWDAAVLRAVDAAIRRVHPGHIAYTLEREEGRRRRYRFADPRCVNDKFTWRKIFDRDPRFTTVSDKLAAKDWVARRDTGLAIAPVLWQGSDAAEIPEHLLRAPGMLKANHGCGTNIPLPTPSRDRADLIHRANGFLQVDHGRDTSQWAYFDIPRRLFVEAWCGAPDAPLDELKFYLFGGRLHRVVHIGGRFADLAANIYDRTPDETWQLSEIPAAVSSAKLDRPLPATFAAAERAALTLGGAFDHMRVDILTDGRTNWFGELTVYNLSGYMSVCGHVPDHPMARDWDLRQSWFLTTPQPGWRGIYARALRRQIDRREGPAQAPT